jgi:hypothetical protein
MSNGLVVFCPDCAVITGKCWRHSVTIVPTSVVYTYPLIVVRPIIWETPK